MWRTPTRSCFVYASLCVGLGSGFPSGRLIIGVPFCLLFGVDKGTQKDKGQKGISREPRGLGLGRRVWGVASLNRRVK